MRCLLSWASFFSCVLLVLAIIMQRRGMHGTDWVRVRAKDQSAVLACAGDSIGAAIFTDSTGWTTRDRQPVKYKRLKPADLRRHFDSTYHGFAYRADGGGAHLVLAPTWSLIALGVTPPALLFAGVGKRRRAVV